MGNLIKLYLGEGVIKNIFRASITAEQNILSR